MLLHAKLPKTQNAKDIQLFCMEHARNLKKAHVFAWEA